MGKKWCFMSTAREALERCYGKLNIDNPEMSEIAFQKKEKEKSNLIRTLEKLKNYTQHLFQRLNMH
jgi:hypothetical protein